MKENNSSSYNIESDDKSSSRKSDHIELAFQSAVAKDQLNNRFNYEPMFSGHGQDTDLSINFLGKELKCPIWISSMTGGTEKAKVINKNLAKICGKFGMGMGLGSCRQLLFDDSRIHEFDIRDELNNQPFYANLGIAQIEKLLQEKEEYRIDDLLKTLSADGLIIHINPLQEWMQPEGDRYKIPPIETIKTLLQKAEYPIVVKEVGQGFGPRSINELLKLPIKALDLAGFGGTNFSKLELLRSDKIRYNAFKEVYNLGHSCEEMLEIINNLYLNEGEDLSCKQIIFSGGIRNFLDGYYFISKSKMKSIYAQASGFLKYATDYESLLDHVECQIEGLKMANSFLTIKN